MQSLKENEDLIANSPDLRRSLLSLVRPVLETHYAAYLPTPGGTSQPPLTTTLACGVQADGSPWIHEIDHQCNITDYEERGFHAIGSGAPFAQLANALVAHFEVRQRPVEHGKLVAHRVMDIAISTSAYGIGGPIQMWQITGDQVSRMSNEELDAIRDSVGAWQEVEKAALDEHMSGSLEVIDLDAELPINGEPAGDGNTGVEPAPNDK